MEKRVLARAVALGTVVVVLFFGANLQGSDGAQLGGGGCGRLEAPASDANADADQDGVADALDNCPALFNPHQTDSDGNGVGEVCESAQTFDGQIECPFPSCENGATCEEFLQQSCEQDAFELAFLEMGVACCDQACVVFDTTKEGNNCPTGTCQSPWIHCSSDEECLANGFDECFEGCCVGGEGP